MPYKSPISELQFILEHVVDYQKVVETPAHGGAGPETVAMILAGAAKYCDEILAPLNSVSDVVHPKLENGTVKTAPGIVEAYKAFASGGWVGVSAPEQYGGMALPTTLNFAVDDLVAGACLSFQLMPFLTRGQIDALEAHASETLKETYLPKLVSGEWAGTMNLTEPQAGSDVGALRTQAAPNEDGTFAITGQKIFISWADHDLTENICHLVLARFPDAPGGTKGISLFLVPKYLPSDTGGIGASNAVNTVSLEHKLGLHGSPTAVMQYDGAVGWMVGPENGGMAAMFTMMNVARLGVGLQGVGAAEAALQKAAEFSAERKQHGRAIIDHADVRRMLMTMKAEIFAARTICYACAVSIDLERATDDAEARSRAAFLTPIAKTFGTDTGVDMANMGIQVHGGMGYVEETGAAQFMRDARVTQIYEGTNGIQAMDLVGRKLTDGGDAAFRLLDEIEGFAELARRELPDLGDAVWGAAETLRESTELLLEYESVERSAVGVPYLRAFARVLGGHFHLKAAVAAGPGSGRAALARFYIQRLMPEYVSLLAHVSHRGDGLFDLENDDFVA